MLYVKALHIIFVVTWFAGLFYMPRLFIYNIEAQEKDEHSRSVLQQQFTVMMKRLWYGITWPSAILNLIFGVWVMYEFGYFSIVPTWLWLKLLLVLLLYVYHLSLHYILVQQVKGVFRYTSHQLRMYNEVATVFLVAIVMLVVVKQGLSMVWGVVGIILFIILLMVAINIYKLIRKRGEGSVDH